MNNMHSIAAMTHILALLAMFARYWLKFGRCHLKPSLLKGHHIITVAANEMPVRVLGHHRAMPFSIFISMTKAPLPIRDIWGLPV